MNRIGRAVGAPLLAVGGGALWGLAFGREIPPLLPWIALAPLVLLLGGRAGALATFLLGWLHGIVAWWVAIPWIVPTLETYGGLEPWLAWPLLGLLAAYLGLYHGAFAALGASLWRRGGAVPALLGLPALWVVLEWTRGWLLTGFPWNLAAYVWTDVPGALPLAAWVGPWGVSFLVAMGHTAVARSLARRGWRPAVAALLGIATLLAVGGRWGAREAEGVPGFGLPVRLVQPDIDNLTDFDPRAIAEGQERLFALSRQACDRQGVLLVWPESAGWPFRLEGDGPGDAAFRRRVEALAAAGCPVLLNSNHGVSDAPGDHNSIFLLTAPGEVARYDKRHLVPFGEYVPLAGVFSFLDKLARNAGEFVPGGEIRLLPWRGEELGAAICFEITFPGEVAELAREGATVLVTVTNDAWYGDTAAPWQHFRAARFRAAENRRPLLRSAITGVSGLIAADGRVVAALGVGEEGVIRGRVSGRRALSPYTRAPWLVPALCSLTAVLAIFLSLRTSGVNDHDAHRDAAEP